MTNNEQTATCVN